MRIKDLSLLRSTMVRLLVVAMSVLGLSSLSAGASMAAVRPQSCGPAVTMPGEHYVHVNSVNFATVYLVYDCSTYSTYAVIDGSALGGTSAWWLAVDIVDQNGNVVYHGDTRGYDSSSFARTLDVSLNYSGSPKMYQARAWFRNTDGCSAFFDSDWHSYSYGGDQGGGWDTSC